MRTLDKYLNSITMYKLLLYGLLLLLLVAAMFGWAGLLPFGPLALLGSAAVLFVVCFGSNLLLARLYGASTNVESSALTALILACILTPPRNAWQLAAIAMVGVIAMASKYVLAWEEKHVFNPAAFGATVASLTGLVTVGWWIGSQVMLVFVLVLGLLVVHKIRRTTVFGVFVVVSLATLLVFGLTSGITIDSVLRVAIVSGPLVFFGTIMLIEPTTTPADRRMRLIYGGLVGILYGLHFSWGVVSSTPQLALLVGNIFAFAVTPRARRILTLKSKKELADNIYDFAFTPNKPLQFIPGQYLEWTEPQLRQDSRGNRRYFTIASSPADPEIHLGIKCASSGMKSSSFKSELLDMKPGDTLSVSQLSGEFVLPKSPQQKMVLIAGGIGVTPFVAMARDMTSVKQQRDMVLFYNVADPKELVYLDDFARAKEFGLQLVQVVNTKENVPKDWTGETGYLTPEMVGKYVSDVTNRRYYISGPNAMVENYRSMLGKMGVNRRNIVTDYFPGY